MSSNFRAGDKCDYCGITYRKFRTGFTYQEVFDLLKTDESENPEEWTYKRRKRVLYVWCTMKQEFWEFHTELGGCEKDPRNQIKDAFDLDCPF